MTISPAPNGERIKLTGDSSKKSRFIFGTRVSAFMISGKSKSSASPIAREYLLSFCVLETIISYFPASAFARYSGPAQ